MAPKNKKNKPKKGKNDGKKEEKDDTQIDIVKKSLEAFDKLEADLDTVIQGVLDEPSLRHLKNEYFKLYRALQRSNDSERRLYDKYDRLKSEMENNINKVKTAVRLSDEDQKLIEKLKEETEDLWRSVEAADEKHNIASTTIKSLREELSTLTTVLDEGIHKAQHREVKINALKNNIDKLKEQTQKLNDISADLTMKKNTLTQDVEELKMKHEALSQDLEDVRLAYGTNKDIEEKEGRRKDRMEAEVLKVAKKVATQEEELNEQHNTLDTLVHDLHTLEQELREDRRQHERIIATNEENTDELNMLKGIYHKEVEARIEADDNHKKIENELHIINSALGKAKHDKGKIDNDIANLKLGKISDDDKKRKLVNDKEKISARVMTEIMNTMKSIRKFAVNDASTIDTLLADRDVFNKLLMRIHSKGQKELNEMERIERVNDGLEYEINNVKKKIDVDKREIQTLIKEREKFGLDISTANSKCMRGIEEIKTRENKVIEARKIINEDNAELVIQKGLYDDARAERNEYCKKLKESEDEISQLRRQLKVMNHEVEELEGDIKAKDDVLMKEHFRYNRILRNADSDASVRAELMRIREKQKESEEGVSDSRNKVTELESSIIIIVKRNEQLEDELKKIEKEKGKIEKEYMSLMAEKDIMGANLVRRNDELALLYEKLRVQENTIDEGSVEHSRKEDEGRSISLVMESTKRNIANLNIQVDEEASLRNEVYRLQQELMKEKSKVRGLVEELENPDNTQRWRALEGTDLNIGELEDKINTLQKRLIRKSEELVNYDLELQSKEEHRLELYRVLMDETTKGEGEEGTGEGIVTGVDLAREATDLQRELAKKTRCMKAVAAELNMSYAHVNELQEEIKSSYDQLLEAKEMYHEQRRRDDLTKKSAKP
ncbi:merozoite surface protein 3B, putative [Perkinsus marinus ATCC 50983]|uniref:Merozoite surface protein 3B, putative n=1 Tax=Perkinsus marinus (strain ATCC 50983 / TXsc) TaxID=423536 RepID=C5LXA7_PERM5|nr:merozoite surface protein 3B, putative [Perkinsus marinus ATCC 50983]EEQ98656.1 merozoite surface protein 3B, putative [Perkinsus marinus ATCC 50983]|eukprot:XP_002765939.1 merozoite surface protein 3B, putative [Perkinsus marinus ATCC 50983]